METHRRDTGVRLWSAVVFVFCQAAAVVLKLLHLYDAPWALVLAPIGVVMLILASIGATVVYLTYNDNRRRRRRA